MNVTITTPPPQPDIVTIELSRKDASALATLIGKYQLSEVSAAMEKLWDRLFDMGLYRYDEVSQKAEDNLKLLYGSN